jgi:hypothetical protein
MSKRGIVGTLGVFVVGLVGCGGSNEGPATGTGHFIGGLVENVSYVCGDSAGRTGRLGEFTYRIGEPCDFDLGGLSFRASARALEDGSVTAYDLTRSATEAWALTALLDAISHRRPGTDLFRIVDGTLARRLPPVDLRQGDLAIEAALAPFEGTTKPVSVEAGRALLERFVDESNRPVRPLEEIVAEGERILATLRIPHASAFAEAQVGETDHNNRVNLRVYDYEGNPLTVNSVSYEPGEFDGDWLWVTSDQNPDDNSPVVGLDEGDIEGPNIFGIDLDVGRHQSTDVATDYMNHAFSPGTFPAPVTILAAGVADDEETDSHFGQELNFGYHINLIVYTANGAFNCNNIMFGQGSTGTSLETYLDLAKDLGETAFDGFKFVASDGEEVQEGVEAMKSFTEFVGDLFDIHFQNWWIMGLNAQSESYRVTAWGNPAVLMQCYQNGTSMAVVGYSDYDDHTFNLQVSFPGQGITVTD